MDSHGVIIHIEPNFDTVILAATVLIDAETEVRRLFAHHPLDVFVDELILSRGGSGSDKRRVHFVDDSSGATNHILVTSLVILQLTVHLSPGVKGDVKFPGELFELRTQIAQNLVLSDLHLSSGLALELTNQVRGGVDVVKKHMPHFMVKHMFLHHTLQSGNIIIRNILQIDMSLFVKNLNSSVHSFLFSGSVLTVQDMLLRHTRYISPENGLNFLYQFHLGSDIESGVLCSMGVLDPAIGLGVVELRDEREAQVSHRKTGLTCTTLSTADDEPLLTHPLDHGVEILAGIAQAELRSFFPSLLLFSGL